MKSPIAGVVTFAACIVVSVFLAGSRATHALDASSPTWNARAAAGYLDGRMEWWLHWPNAARDHDTACVSCHTALPYALARPGLHTALGEHDLAAPELTMLAHVTKRVRIWKEV